MLVQVLKAMDEFTHHLDSFIFRQVFLFLHVRIQVPAIAVLHYQVEVIRCLLHVVQSYYVGVLAAFQDFYLALQQFSKFTCIQSTFTFDLVSLNGFHCNLVISCSIVAPEDLPVLSGPDFLVQHIVVNQFRHAISITPYYILYKAEYCRNSWC